MANFSVSEYSISDVIEDARSGALTIPTFQRDFVWTVNQVKALLDSIRKGVPLGAIVVWGKGAAQNADLFEQYFSSATQELGGWTVLDQTEASNGSWKVDTVPYSSASPRPAFSSQAPINSSAIIDGRQRTQSLMIAFGGVCYGHKKKPHNSIWYLDLTKDLHGEDSPFGRVKSDDVISGDYSTISGWIKHGRLPLWLSDVTQFIPKISDTAHYGSLPNDLADRIQRASEWSNIISKTKLAKLSLPATTSLSDVCDIFETLNEAGTKVSAFDIVNATVHGSTKGMVDIKRRLGDAASGSFGQFPGFSSWTSSTKDMKTFAQAVTLGYCITPELQTLFPSAADVFSSVKGEALIKTPAKLYAHMLDVDLTGQHQNNQYPIMEWIESVYRDFNKVTKGNAGLQSPQSAWCPSPVLFAVYFALRLHEKYSGKFSVDALNSAFRAYYWRCVLGSIYDQGYLTMAFAHTKGIRDTLVKEDQTYSSSKIQWWGAIDACFSGFTTPAVLPVQSDIEEMLINPPNGTLKKATLQLLLSNSPKCLRKGTNLDAFNGSDTELHHMFPKKWIKDNISDTDIEKLKDAPALLVPLRKEHNNQWSSGNPAMVLGAWFKSKKRDDPHLKSNLESLLVPTTPQMMDILFNDGLTSETRLESFVKDRASFIAGIAMRYCLTADLP